MSSTHGHSGAIPNELGTQLRAWRDMRGKSQLDLSLDTGISQRQISFIESGRSTPGRHNLLHLADALDVPFRERNTLLLAAGYAPIYGEGGIDDVEMKGVTDALRRMLVQHEPFPAVVMDRYWNVVMTNDATQRFFNGFVDMAAREKPRNLLHLMFDPAGLRPFIPNWEETAKSLMARVFRESVGRVVDTRTRALIDALLAYPHVDSAWKVSTTADSTPVIPLSFIKDGQVLRFFSLVTTVGTAQTITTQELRIECMFPLDEATEVEYAKLMKQADAC
ncbi:XRE family transcriptional regulator (plasmid) [Rhizobium leguminosarum]|uniref:helix-turn-helix domain-containing protein n=1 Tax=Rhizobium TaxID=379 RepID=UPI00102FBF8D|nr:MULTISPECIES: helix-turn-helix transcriptional regulator [Rhizobium]TBC88867.1 XRE family transcriptional regulator [Rhizobium leguminosarum]WSG93152.1 helix-turn-helix transcriptional regulator [Rhizobium beringeri]